jgi:hypothetical protein
VPRAQPALDGTLSQTQNGQGNAAFVAYPSAHGMSVWNISLSIIKWGNNIEVEIAIFYA